MDMTGYETQLRGYERGNAASPYTREVNISKTCRWDPIERIWEGDAASHHTRDVNTSKRERLDRYDKIRDPIERIWEGEYGIITYKRNNETGMIG